MQINHYLTADDRDLYQDWLDGLRDMRARVAIQRCCQELERPYPTFSVEDVDAVVAEAQFYRDGNA